MLCLPYAEPVAQMPPVLRRLPEISIKLYLIILYLLALSLCAAIHHWEHVLASRLGLVISYGRKEVSDDATLRCLSLLPSRTQFCAILRSQTLLCHAGNATTRPESRFHMWISKITRFVVMGNK